MKIVDDFLLGLLIGIPTLACCDIGINKSYAGNAPGCVDTRKCCDKNDSKGDRCDENDNLCICDGLVSLRCKAVVNVAGNCIPSQETL
ncbi:MAG: hypothetical protein ACK5YR_15055 [Pirellula sp.]|jgi:hypothetical protein